MLKIWCFRCLEILDYIAKIIIGRGCGIFSEEFLQFSDQKASWNGKIMREKVKKRVFEILEVASDGDVFSRIVDIFIMALILTNVMAVILETVGSLAAKYMLSSIRSKCSRLRSLPLNMFFVYGPARLIRGSAIP